jgi:probable HAF family extracellular repeat protein
MRSHDLLLLVPVLVAVSAHVVGCNGDNLAEPSVPSYETHDLGTLGGPDARAMDINRAGQVVGSSMTGPTGIVGQAFLWESGAMTPLAPAGIYSYTAAYRIASDGRVLGAGMSMIGGPNVGLLWNGADVTELRGPGGEQVAPNDINDQGQVVGQLIQNPNEIPAIGHAFVGQNGITTDLGTLGGPSSAAAANNEAGQIVGWSQTAAGEYHLVIWQNRTVIDLGTLGGGLLSPAEINGSGQIVGSLARVWPGPLRAFLWENGVLTRIGDWSRSESIAYDINEAGEVVGYVIPGDCVGDPTYCWRAFVWKNGVMTDLGAGFMASIAFAINDAGVIVGTARVANDTWHAMMWVPR